MSNFWGFSTRRGSRAACPAVAALVGLALLGGCGGGSTSTTSAGRDAAEGATGSASGGGATSAGPERSQVHAGADRSKEAAAGGGDQPGDGANADHGRRAERSSAKPGQVTTERSGSTGSSSADAPGNSLAGASPVAVRKLRKHCPKKVDSKTCGELVKAYIASQGTESQTVASPEGCTATRTKAECEEVLRSESEAAEGESVGVQECLAHMTPRCEAILRPIFESQQAAQSR